MNTRKLSAGDIIDARCTRCREILNHRIVAMVGDKVVRVECNTCGGVHNYYPPPPPKTAKIPRSGASPGKTPATPSTPRAPRRDPGQSDREEWMSLRSGMKPEQAISYDMNAKFKVDNLINHPVFGLGVVKLIVAPNKMRVLFEDGVKLLRCK